MIKSIYLVFFGLLLTAFSCDSITKDNEPVLDSTIVQGELILFYSSSMVMPMQHIISGFENEYPYVHVQANALGSRTAALKISELNKACDVLISSDYQVIKNLLIPNYASWYVEFSTNEMVLAYSDSSRKSDIISPENWYHILLNDRVRFGRADPDSDPCGIRSVLLLKLTEKYYEEFGLKDQLLFKDKKFIRQSDIELLKLLENKELDYIFVYKSEALQHHLKYISFPEKINLGSTKEKAFYAEVSMKVSSNKPGVYISRKGEPIRYAFTVLKNASNIRAAKAFIKYFVDKNKGFSILKNDSMNLIDSLTIMPNDSLLRKQFGADFKL